VLFCLGFMFCSGLGRRATARATPRAQPVWLGGANPARHGASIMPGGPEAQPVWLGGADPACSSSDAAGHPRILHAAKL
jgi:hypothetical protein